MQNKSNRLPVISIFTQTICLFSDNFFEILVAGIPYLLLSLCILLIPQFAQNIIQRVPQSLTSLIWILMLLLYIMLTLTAIISIHRIYLSTQYKLQQRDSWGQAKRLLRLILWQILITFFTMLIVSPLLVTTAVGVMFNLSTKSGLNPYFMVFFAISALIASYVMTRFSLAIPAVTCDQKEISIHWAWQLSSGNGWRLSLLVWALPIAVSFLPILLPASDSILLATGYKLIQLAATAISIGTLSLSYHWLSERQKMSIIETQAQPEGAQVGGNELYSL